ncbi:MAG: Gfo/Idh/MocA family oxidoreductase [Candidatus Limivivens sp.]|nr:Gfo/Idh/MocA family oxidoreductase [Candidatus Limivivens sp.]
MYISIFSDELYLDASEVLPIVKNWGMKYVDFRGQINGKGIEYQTDEELYALKAQLDSLGLKAGVLQTSLAKKHLPDKEVLEHEQEKLEGIIRASKILGTKLVRCFNYWQQEPEDRDFGKLAMMPDLMNQVLERFMPLAKRAKEAGLILGFENCGQTPNEVIALLKALNVPEWGMAWDVANYFDVLPEAEGDCIDYFQKALRYTNMIHVKSWGVLDELGYKKVPWDRILTGAAVTGKNLPISVETHNPPSSPYTHQEASKMVYEAVLRAWPAAAPSDMRTALSVKQEFVRDYAENPVNFVVVGLGMGKNRAKQLTETSGTRLYGVCDINLERAKEIGELFHVPYSDDINVFLQDPEVEVMYVVTPTGLHCSVADQCLDAGKHVLMTKPMDADVASCDVTIQKAKEKGLLLGLDFDFQFDEGMESLRQAVKNGYFGKLISANIMLNVFRSDEYFLENGGWRGTWALDGGGAMSNQGVHEVQRLISLFGMPKEVKGDIFTKNHDIEAEDDGISLWKYENGFTARFSSTTCYPASSWSVRIEIIGTEGVYYYTLGGPEGDHTYWWKDGRWSEQNPYPAQRKWRQASDNFAYCLRTGAALEVDWKPGRDSRLVLDKLYESGKNGGVWTAVEE